MDTFISKIHPEEIIPDWEKEIYDLSKNDMDALMKLGETSFKHFYDTPNSFDIIDDAPYDSNNNLPF